MKSLSAALVGLMIVVLSACNLVDIVNRYAPADQAPAGVPTTTFWFDIGEPVAPAGPTFDTQTAPQAPGSEDDGRFENEPAGQSPCDAPYPACGRP